MMGVSIPRAGTAAFLLCTSTSVAAADYTGFWKMDCADSYGGVRIKPDVDKTYSISFCRVAGCWWRPNSKIDGDPAYRVIDANTLEARADETQPWRRYKKCTTETRSSSSQSRRFRQRSGFTQPSPLWFGTWKSQDGTASITIAPTKMVHTFPDRQPDGRLGSTTLVFEWSDFTDGGVEDFGYSARRISPDKIAERYEAAARQFEKDPTDFVISDPTTSRRAIAAISPGVYRILWSLGGGDCYGWEFILDGDRMLESSGCKDTFVVKLYNRATTE
jgi:hypothetical protein